MRLRSRLLLGFGITLGLMLVVVVWAVLNFVWLGRASDAILRENYNSILAAETMIAAIERQDSAILLILLGFDDEGLRQFLSYETTFLQWLGRAKDNITIAGEADVLERLESGYTEYLNRFTRLRERRIVDENQGASYYQDEVLPLFRTLRAEATRLRQLNQDTMFTASAQAERIAARAIWSTLVVASAVVLVGVGFSFLLSRRLSEPIQDLLAATENLAEGDYDVEVRAHGADELIRLGQAFNEMARKLGSYHQMNVERMVAERRRSDAVLQSIEDGMVVVDGAYKVINLNRQAARILNVDARAAIDTHVLEILPSERIFHLIKASAEAERSSVSDSSKANNDQSHHHEINNGQPNHHEANNHEANNHEANNYEANNYAQRELVIERAGTTYHYECAVTAVQSAAGAVLGVVLQLRDVTRLKEIETMKNTFLMTASHELKTPLQSLGMSIELLLEQIDDHTDARQVALVEAAAEEIARLKRLVSDLLDLSRIESGRMELDITPVPIGILIAKAISLLASQAEEREVVLEADVAEQGSEDIAVQADPNKATWVLTNLIGNALRYAQHRITVTARPFGDWLHVSVSDDGEGIPPELQSRIFDKFVHAPGSEASGSTGLGLAICREIVRAHGGTIWLDSTPAAGSTFTFTLPMAHHKTAHNETQKET